MFINAAANKCICLLEQTYLKGRIAVLVMLS